MRSANITINVRPAFTLGKLARFCSVNGLLNPDSTWVKTELKVALVDWYTGSAFARPRILQCVNAKTYSATANFSFCIQIRLAFTREIYTLKKFGIAIAVKIACTQKLGVA